MASIIRAATVEDLPHVRRLQEQWATDGETIGFQATPTDLLAAVVGGCFFVATEQGDVVGFVYARAKHNDGAMSAVFADRAQYLEIEDLYVVPNQRSAGIGARLVQSAADWAEQHRIRYLSAYSSTRDVDRVLRFYRACGFESWFVQVFRDLGEAV